MGVVFSCAFGGWAAAQQSASTHYSVNEVFFGSGGALNDCSTTYCAKESLGETGVGTTKSPSYQAHAGFNTDRQPYIQVNVNAANINLGTLTPGTPATATATFSVKTYLASGYTVTTQSPGPASGSYVLNLLTTPTASAPNTEQFGINLAANNSCGNGLPASLGANPVQVPSSAFSFGTVPASYNQACKFMYKNGDTIAQSSSSSGETDYTISYLFNITNTTRAGTYTMDDVLVATSTY